MLVILIIKNDIFLYKQKYLHQIIIYIFAKQKTKKKVSLDLSKNIQVNLMKNIYN